MLEEIQTPKTYVDKFHEILARVVTDLTLQPPDNNTVAKCDAFLHELQRKRSYSKGAPYAMVYILVQKQQKVSMYKVAHDITEGPVRDCVREIIKILNQHYPQLAKELEIFRIKSGTTLTRSAWNTIALILEKLTQSGTPVSDTDQEQCKLVFEAILSRGAKFPKNYLIHASIVAWACPHLLEPILNSRGVLHYSGFSENRIDTDRKTILKNITFIVALNSTEVTPESLFKKIEQDIPLSAEDRNPYLLSRYAHLLESFCQQHTTEVGLEVLLMLRKIGKSQKKDIGDILL